MRTVPLVICLLVLTVATAVPTTAAAVNFSHPHPTMSREVGANAPSSSRAIDVRLRAAIRMLPVAREIRVGYDRDLFRHWTDANGDCQDARDEVLAAESLVQVSGCDIARGRWFSYYDATVWRHSGDVDVDHLVPLAEAWDSGARRWAGSTRERYANDVRDHRTLVAVTDNVNSSKSDQDIAEWLPQYSHCRYLRSWVAVKVRWSLTVDHAEKRRLHELANGCRNPILHVVRAPIRLAAQLVWSDKTARAYAHSASMSM